MERKIVLMAVLLFLFSAIFATQVVTPVRAEATPTEEEPLDIFESSGYSVNANGTVFQITNSSYLNVTLTSSEYVHMFLESIPRMVSYNIESLSSATSSVLTLSGFVPSTTYHRYQDGNLTESFTTDSAGNYTYMQDILSPHHIFIVENMTTIYIRPDGTVEPETAPIQRVGDVYTFTGNISDSIVVQRDNIVVDGAGYTVEGAGTGTGIGLYGEWIYRNNVTVKNVRITQFSYGVYFYTTINSRIENITATGNWYGIRLWGSRSCTVLDNTVTNNVYGIQLYYSLGNTLSGNTMAGNLYNFGVESGAAAALYDNVVDLSNLADGKPIYYVKGASNVVYDASTNAATFYIIASNNVTVRDLTLTNNYVGVFFLSTGNSRIENISATNNEYGIRLAHSSVTISNNTVTKNSHDGIYLYYSGGNTFTGNTVTNNHRGIRLYYSDGCTISDNTVANNGKWGIYLDGGGGCTISDNTVTNHKWGIYDSGSGGNTVSGNSFTNSVYGIYLDYSDGNTISDNTVTNNMGGIFLVGGASPDAYVTDNTVSNNTVINNNNRGIVLMYSASNTFSGNNISNNRYGVSLGLSSGNTFYHNNFIDNIWYQVHSYGSVNAWDTSYPSGGNYWSDYTDADFFSGPNQDESGSDGIGDSPYIIDANNRDRYPFIYESGWLGNTPVGTDIASIDPATGITVTFDEVTSSGTTTVATSTTGPPPPTGFRIVGVPGQPVYYKITTTATYSGTITVAIRYDETQVKILEDKLKLWQFNTGWNDITWYVDTTNNIIYGTSTHLSLFIIAELSQYHLIVQTDPSGITNIPGEGWYDVGTDVTLEAPTIVPVSTGMQYRFDYWAVDGNVVSGNPITVHLDANHTATAHYVKQHYLTVISPYDVPGGEGWYDEGETAYALLQVGLEYVNGLAYGFVGWSGDTTGWDLISDPIIVDAPKTVIANWESSEAYGDVRTVGFWKYQVNVWYFTELKNNGMKIRGLGKAQISEEEIITFLTFIDGNSDYFRGRIVKDNDSDGAITNLEILENAYNILKTPRGQDTMKARAEQQLLAVWLNLAMNAFFWNTELSQDTLYIYYQYNFESEWGLATIGEAVLFCEAELAKLDGNYEAAKDICDSINNNLGIV